MVRLPSLRTVCAAIVGNAWRDNRQQPDELLIVNDTSQTTAPAASTEVVFQPLANATAQPLPYEPEVVANVFGTLPPAPDASSLFATRLAAAAAARVAQQEPGFNIPPLSDAAPSDIRPSFSGAPTSGSEGESSTIDTGSAKAHPREDKANIKDDIELPKDYRKRKPGRKPGSGRKKNRKIAKEEENSDEDKTKSRAEQCREASRRYRKRKKALVDVMEHRMEELMEEKQRLLRDKESAMELVRQLRNENLALKQKHSEESKQVEAERMLVIKELDQLIRSGSATDELVWPFILKLRDCCGRICNLGQCHLEFLISADTTSLLVNEGFFSSEEAEVDKPSSKEGIFNFVTKIKRTVTTMTQQQHEQLDQLVALYYKKLDDVREERENLKQELTTFFGQGPFVKVKQEEGGMQPMLGGLALLEYLRKNLAAEARHFEDAMDKLMLVLTPLQQAHFYLTVEFQHASVMQLKAMWTSLNQSK